MPRIHKKSGENKRTRILRAVPTNEWVNSAQVARASGVDPELVCPQLSALYKAGFLERRETGGSVIEHRVLFKRIVETIYLVGRTGSLRRHHQLRDTSNVTGLITVGHTTHRGVPCERKEREYEYSCVRLVEEPELPRKPSLLGRIFNGIKRIFGGVST